MGCAPRPSEQHCLTASGKTATTTTITTTRTTVADRSKGCYPPSTKYEFGLHPRLARPLTLARCHHHGPDRAPRRECSCSSLITCLPGPREAQTPLTLVCSLPRHKNGPPSSSPKQPPVSASPPSWVFALAAVTQPPVAKDTRYAVLSLERALITTNRSSYGCGQRLSPCLGTVSPGCSTPGCSLWTAARRLCKLI